jgi:hypothetical protein
MLYDCENRILLGLTGVMDFNVFWGGMSTHGHQE